MTKLMVAFSNFAKKKKPIKTRVEIWKTVIPFLLYIKKSILGPSLNKRNYHFLHACLPVACLSFRLSAIINSTPDARILVKFCLGF
jgi:hypothetical protein